jgi:diadenylate cyclase
MDLTNLKSLALIQDVPLVFSYITSREVLDILIVFLAIYIVLLFVKQTKSYFVLSVSLILIVLNLVSQNLNLTVTRAVLQPLSTLTFIIIAIVFQKEIRRFFRWVTTGQQNIFSRTHIMSKGVSAEIAESLLYMAQHKIGAIIVFPNKQDIDEMIEGGQELNGKITKEILLSIFDPGSSGHDGAVIIENDVIKLFGTHLPLARNYNFRKAGTRHRAAAGITEDTDAIALVVSEERGVISVCKNGVLEKIKDEQALRKLLKDLTGEDTDEQNNFWHYFIVKNAQTKIIALTVAAAIWTTIMMQTGISKKEFTIPLSFQLLPTQYEIDSKTGKSQINVVLQGRSRDISTFDGTKLEAKVDARNFGPGTEDIEITKNMITVPPFLTITEIDPEEVKIIIKEKTQEEAKQEEKII